jgi:hypothetical protein
MLTVSCCKLKAMDQSKSVLSITGLGADPIEDGSGNYVPRRSCWACTAREAKFGATASGRCSRGSDAGQDLPFNVLELQ